MTTDPTELNSALSSNYLLCDLQIRSWSGKGTDKTASNEIITQKGATKDSGQFMKNLMASAGEELKEIHRHQAALRHFVYSQTLPWTSSSEGAKRGERLLASAAAMDFLQEAKPFKQDCDNAVRLLVGVWDERVQLAMTNLGGLANIGDYPGVSELPGMFSISIELRPIPAIGDFNRLNIPATLTGALAARYASTAQRQVTNAMDELKDRMIVELERIHTQLAKCGAGEKTRLYDSLVTNMQGLVQMARNMNLTNNARLAQLADRIEMKLLLNPVSVYREDPAKAVVVAENARQLAAEAAIEDFWK
jgi:hypothetical protein